MKELKTNNIGKPRRFRHFFEYALSLQEQIDKNNTLD